MGPSGERQPAGGANSAPSNRMLRAESSSKLSSLSSLRDYHSEEAKSIEIRSRKVTICLICLISSISCLTPFVSLHLTQRVGLLLFESDLIQLRSSLFTVIICLLVLVIIYSILFFNFIKPDRKTLVIQRIFKQLMGIFAIISAVSYLSIVLIVPQIRQIQRMPLATFDCNANLITIENCQQQFTTKGGEQTLPEAISELLSGDLNGNNERLIKKLNCLKYNDKELDALQVPTRFLLHKCGLVCKPQRQESHQFSDDLNQNNQDWSATMPRLPEKNPVAETKITLETSSAPELPKESPQQHRPLIPPYRNDLIEPQNRGLYLNHLTHTHNASSISSAHDDQASTKAVYDSLSEDVEQRSNQQQVSLKVCFSGEFTGGSNYKQFCITNLANNIHGQDHTLTVGQLNAMLRKFVPTSSGDLLTSNLSQGAPSSLHDKVSEADKSTQYMNPVVQFESHFKNWPQLSRSSLIQPLSGTNLDETLFGSQVINGESENGSREGWCSFRPIPPFIVNNKPFSDIQCSLEHEYTMTTGPSLDSVSFSGRGADKIYLKKSSAEGTGSITRERCNIQCKVNILYQVHMSSNEDGSSRRRSRRRDSVTSAKDKGDAGTSRSGARSEDDLHYYLPLKPCLIVSDDGDKSTTSSYYLVFRSVGDATLILVFILLDLFLFLESIDTKQFQLESKKVRLISLLLVIALMPLLISLLFDLISVWIPNQSYNKARKEGYLTAFLSDRVVPSFIDLFTGSTSSASSAKTRKLQPAAGLDQQSLKQNHSSTGSSHKLINDLDKNINPKRNSVSTYQLDNYMVPFFVYSTLMFTLAINSFTLPLVPSTTQLVRVSSTEELGMASGKVERITGGKVARKHLKNNEQQPVDESKLKQSEMRYTQLYRKQTSKMISLALVALFLGTQFNLSQLTQSQLFLDAFGHSSNGPMQGFAAFWFALLTHSSAAIFVLLLASLFIEEASGFFAGLSPFKSATSAHSTKEEIRRNRARFLNYTTISLLIYSFRHYTLASLSAESSLKWSVVFLFQLAELFNFPLTWFALTTRAHEIVLEYRASHKLLANSPTAEAEVPTQQQTSKAARVHKHTPESRAKAMAIHILVQSAAAFTYFVLSRSLALFLHSLNASLHLHSDNVDWFITSFHQQHNNDRQREHSPSISADAKQSNSSERQQQQHQQQLNDRPPPETLFSPLPGERQTYLHASRLFLRYNSLLCLLIGLVLLAALIYVKYQIWADQRRTLDVYHSSSKPEQSADDDSIGDRLSLDLMRIHADGNQTQMRNIYPEPASKLPSPADKQLRRPQSPRAKILFHYNLDRRDSSSSLSSSAVPAPPKDNNGRHNHESARDHEVVETTRMGSRGGSTNELRIPIEIVGTREPDEMDEIGQPTQAGDQVVERITEHRNKRVRILEDSENWPNEEDEIEVEPTLSPPEPERPARLEQMDRRRHHNQPKVVVDRNRKRRTISFAPTATLIGHDGTQSEHKGAARSGDTAKTAAQRASPESSIDNESELESAESD